jgi:hypothetical protein
MHELSDALAIAGDWQSLLLLAERFGEAFGAFAASRGVEGLASTWPAGERENANPAAVVRS